MKVNDEMFVAAGADSENYLGNPAVVRRVLQGFVDKIYTGIKKRGAGTLSKEDFVTQLDAMSREFSDIFLGKNPDYVKVQGWNSPYALGIAITQVLGVFWEKNKEHYDGDKGRVLFAWIAASLVDEAQKSQDDPDSAGLAIQGKLDNVTKLLLNLQARR